ncbi:MAG: cellulase family glycosylhydrolase [Gammaproteobacteria bacterium]|nr:cellulase family glycosylhydrolase [Gammaproteobacteria bacterium]
MKWIYNLATLSLLIFYTSLPAFANNAVAKTVPVPVAVKVTVGPADWVQTISICNTSSKDIPLTNVEFRFNYAGTMSSNIWGQPWVAWKLASQANSEVVLTGGTSFTPPLASDPNCTRPLTIQFSSTPSTPVPTGPFIFKAEGGQPSALGTLNINLAAAPATGLPDPTLTLTGEGTTTTKKLTWGASWKLSKMTAGSYTIAGSLVNTDANNGDYYAADNVLATVTDQQTTNVTVTYKPVPAGRIKITLIKPPTTKVQLNFTGKNYSFTKTVGDNGALQLPNDTYNVTSVTPGQSASIVPNPITLPTDTKLTVTYSQTHNSAGPYTTVNGQIVDKNQTPVTFQGVNWFGFNTGNHMLHGLWQGDFETMLQQIKSVGFNAVRIPFQFDFILNPAIKPSGITSTCNGKPCNTNIPQDSALNAFQYIVKRFTDAGLYVMIDDHYEDDTYINNYSQWIAGWQKVAQMFINNPSVGYDLWNEPDSHSMTWEGGTNSWSKGIREASTAIYNIDPTKLIFIEGVAQGALRSNWGDGFATDNATIAQGISNPKNLFTQMLTQPYLNQIVISPHAYGPDGTNNQGPDHSDPTIAFADWSRLNGYLLNNFLNVNNTPQSGFCAAGKCHLFPIALGEFGGKFDPADPYYQKDTATLINLANYIVRLGSGKPALPSWFYWDWNPNSGNTGGILKDDWATIDCNKVNYLKKYLFLKPAANICP